ncbi:FGGY-family carbohydrate kinase [Deinococcus cellulosilyticus]|uniref:Carbohydrate kinase n=1 Tax=Deinococcus cellulosilyticus (strain DSM 18568 / NBRC 106333 / KACC 11606 / 5516J-15) TaxID=1223518 RepID=A0A511N0J4_DEIC1|nr:FGGY-family carbohydrate kinase [Deinococcus cellulosilyticus]GEM46382.1 carbohydrate kinase [Deinococcus cellulosilyticus NBRC 106333 = KACC 11606]
MKHLLSIDNGTQSLRALLFTPDGQLLASHRVSFSPYESPEPGWAEKDPLVYWNAAGTACQALWDQGFSPEDVLGVAVTTQRGTVVNVDHKGHPLRPAMLWLDQRQATQLPTLPWLYRAGVGLLGLQDTIKYVQGQAEANWLREHQPELWERTHKYLLLSGYLNFKLTGQFVDSAAAQVGYLPFDYRQQRWAHPLDLKRHIAPILQSKLPDLKPAGQVLGHITPSASTHTGLKVGTPVVSCAADKACEALGSGIFKPGQAAISYGTTASITTTSRKYCEIEPFIPPYPSALPGQYNPEVQTFRGFWMVSWFKEEFGLQEVMHAEQHGLPAEVLFDRLIEEVPPGSYGLMLQPYWTPGLRRPAPDAKGAIIGFGDVHKRPHLYRAILEGLAYSMREGKERLERKTHQKIREIRIAGGGAQSDQIMQITANVLNLQVSRTHTPEASGLGAAITVAVGLGVHRDFATALKQMTRPGRIFQPQTAATSTYDALYCRVYRHMYPQLSQLYREIQNITGYPRSC